MSYDDGAALQRTTDQVVIDQAREALAASQATKASEMERVDLVGHAARLEITLKSVLDILDQRGLGDV